VVNTLASFGLAYVLVKFCVGVLGETKHVGLVLVKDRPGWIKVWLYCTIMALITCLLLILIGKRYMHRVCTVNEFEWCLKL